MTAAREARWRRFAEKVRMALASSRDNEPDSGTSGLEIELNILGRGLKPVGSVGAGPERRSFADYLHDEQVPGWARPFFQLEVFHWMTELTTQPHFDPFDTAVQGRLLEGVLINTLAAIELVHGEPMIPLHGNIPYPIAVGADSIPGGWNLARRRYLARCVELYGDRLATAGIHTNHSFPEALLSWDFFHLPLSERRGATLDSYRSHAVIRATRLLRPYCPIFIAISAASPLSWRVVDGEPRVVVTDVDSQRLVAFPNPETLDVGGLYASHEDYLRISYDLVRRGVRFGANNWTPVRARSDVDPVRRNILATSAQLRELYRRGIYTTDDHGSLEDAERELIIENLCARVDLPMDRVEVRTDEGGDDLELSVAKIVFKELLMLRGYGDPELGAGFAYDADDVARVRRDELAAARDGLEATVTVPFGGRRTTVRELLGATLRELEPLAEGLGVDGHLEPLRAMAAGAPNPAGAIRAFLAERDPDPRRLLTGEAVIEPDLVRELVAERHHRLVSEIERLDDPSGERERSPKLGPLFQGLRDMAREQPVMPVRLERSTAGVAIELGPDRTRDVVALAAALVRIPSVTNCPDERLDQVGICARFIAGWLREAGLDVRLFDDARYPSLVAGFPGRLLAPITLSGHFDVVPPEPDDSQFEPRIDGDYLWGRGAADMKTVVASMMIWMRQAVVQGPPYPPLSLVLVGNEENGESEPWGTPHLLAELESSDGWAPEILVVGERTGERGDELYGAVCPESRGVARLRFIAIGARGHTGTGAVPIDLLDRLVELKRVLTSVFHRHLTLSSVDGWESAARFPFLNVGQTGVYNITAGEGVLGLEIRPIPSDDLDGMRREIAELCRELDIRFEVEVMEPGVACPADNPHLQRLIAAVGQVSGRPPVIGRKKPGSSARFAPGGNAVVWGQTGIGPHARDERHFIPSIEPYLNVLDEFARRCD